MLRGLSEARVRTRSKKITLNNTQNIRLILLQKSNGVHYLVIAFSKCPWMLSAGFLAVLVRSLGTKN